MKARDTFREIGPLTRWVVLRRSPQGPKDAPRYVSSAHWFKWTANIAADHWLLGSGRVVRVKDLELTGED